MNDELPRRIRPAVPVVPGGATQCQHCPRSIYPIGKGADVWQSREPYATTCFVGADARIVTHKPLPRV